MARQGSLTWVTFSSGKGMGKNGPKMAWKLDDAKLFASFLWLLIPLNGILLRLLCLYRTRRTLAQIHASQVQVRTRARRRAIRNPTLGISRHTSQVMCVCVPRTSTPVGDR